MKQLTSYNRVAGYLNKMFDMLNAEFFEGTLSRPTITIQSTPRAYGHFSLRDDTWTSATGDSHEINIGAGTLARPIEQVAATLLHEMVHYFNYENGVQDCSRGNTYHNKRFKAAAEAHGLTDILINRNEYGGFQVTGTGTHSGTGATGPRRPSSTRKYICPCCGNSVRATKTVNIACLDCNVQMVVAG